MNPQRDDGGHAAEDDPHLPHAAPPAMTAVLPSSERAAWKRQRPVAPDPPQEDPHGVASSASCR
ncbi:hypothetical protein [Streptomyces reniochalinae]|uniref:hypothetical protein n=1 Tax=Streptomyces reniochalinae TaxID=2250578 RepID=UPI0011C05BA3|nr:hypothetical protein [Streptomyces reniochalinae]